ncbi:FRG domain-containing protein [uncultured Cohaesibacter sp.]|uniref:FRG domain-containing protein n=1 Tax=uncultured Cohaesibacter sp. TaxID=1002546 RepID=UPI002AABC354|nr:FRG domain-containing protein [uncultured Cohaesibacter sp.]
MSDFLSEFSFNSATEFLGALSPLTSPSNLEGYIFRGHSDDAYKLIPTSVRAEKKDELWSKCALGKPIDPQSEWEIWHSQAEYYYLREFFKLADRRGLYVPHADRVRAHMISTYDTFSDLMLSAGEWLPDDLLELAGLAQHYGLPTRLLDWSHDPLVSAYFAAASAEPGTCLSVWALDADQMSYMNQTVKRSPLKLVTPPYHGNPNLAAQSGVFTCWSVRLPSLLEIANSGPLLVDRSPLEELIESHAKRREWKFHRSAFLKFKLSSEHAKDVMKLLERAGYGTSRLFPGYDGVAKEIILRHKS